jgi:hypothetical protein
MVDVTRRGLLGAGAGGLAAASVLSVVARAASFGNPDAPEQGAINAQNPASLTDPGPHSWNAEILRQDIRRGVREKIGHQERTELGCLAVIALAPQRR